MRLRRLLVAFPAAVGLSLPFAALGPPVAAVTYNPSVEAHVNFGPIGSVEGYNWTGDATVDISVNGNLVADDHPLDAPPAFHVDATLSPGDTVTVTGNTTAVVKTLVVAAHGLTLADFANDTATGTASPVPEAMFNVCPMFAGSPPCMTPTVDPVTGDWTADFGTIPFDFTYGMNLMVRQNDGDDDATVTALQVPNPIVQAWDTHGVAINGWTPNSQVTLSVDDTGDAEGPFQWTVTTDAIGSYWDAMPEGAFNPLQPSWSVAATGDVPQLGGTVTKTLVLPDPIPVPEFSGPVVSDTLTGTLSEYAVGPGSRVMMIAFCEGGSTMGTTWLTQSDPANGAFSVDTSVAPSPNSGWGDACTTPVYAVSYRIYDLDGDEFQAWWLNQPTPQINGVPEAVSDGQWIEFGGTGWDLGTVQVVQCQVVNGILGDCDGSTQQELLTNPAEGWPFSGAEFFTGMNVNRFIEVSGQPVDCAVEGSCAIAVFEPFRPGTSAWVPLTMVTVDVEGAAKGTVSTVTGSATVSGTVTASTATGVHLFGELRQRLGRTRVVVGWFDTWVYVDPAQGPTTWSVVVDPQTGQAFGSGKAQLTVNVNLGDEGNVGDQDVVTISLSSSKPARR